MSKHSRSTAFTLISSRYVEILTLVSLLFIIQTGLLPFDFLSPDNGAGDRGFFTTAVNQFTYPDILSNIFLYVPLGFCLHWRFFRLQRRCVIRWLLALGGGLVTSGVIEWLQSYSPARVSSMIDLVSNMIGCALGGVLFTGIQQYLPRFVAAVMAELHTWRLQTTVKAYMLILIFFATMPFSFTLNPGLLKRQAGMVNLIPFASVTGDSQDAEQALVRHDHRAYAFAQWRRLERWGRWIVEALSFAVFAQLLIVLLRNDYGFTVRASVALAGWYCVLLAVVLSLIQFPIISRHVDTTDILFRCAGGLTVAMMTWWTRRSVGLLVIRQTITGMRPRLRIGLYLTMAYIVYSGIIPFIFLQKNGSAFAQSSSTNPLMPFLGYFYTRFDVAADDILEKIATYTVLAIMLVLSTRWYRRGSLSWRAFKVAKFGVCLSIPIEMVQIFIPIRVATITDPLLAIAGCVSGVLILDVIANALRHSSTPTQVSVSQQPSLSPVDELIQTLMQPDPNAPKEPSPKRTTIKMSKI